MRQVTLPSGAVLEVTAAKFATSKGLYQSMLRELQQVKLDPTHTVRDLFKDLFCIGFSSPEIDHWLKECFKHCLYNAGGAKLKIDDDTFEAIERRQDYMIVCVEVVTENIGPFGKALFAVYNDQLEKFGVNLT